MRTKIFILLMIHAAFGYCDVPDAAVLEAEFLPSFESIASAVFSRSTFLEDRKRIDPSATIETLEQEGILNLENAQQQDQAVQNALTETFKIFYTEFCVGINAQEKCEKFWDSLIKEMYDTGIFMEWHTTGNMNRLDELKQNLIEKMNADFKVENQENA